MKNKQTAISYLINELHYRMSVHIDSKLINQVLEMEKEQIIDAHIHGDNEGCSKEWGYDTFGAEQYYNETYGK